MARRVLITQSGEVMVSRRGQEVERPDAALLGQVLGSAHHLAPDTTATQRIRYRQRTQQSCIPDGLQTGHGNQRRAFTKYQEVLK